MNSTPHSNYFIIRFFNEIALYSGQYALFYLLMQFSSKGSSFWFDNGHVTLLIALVVQTTALVFYGDKIFPRISLSFLSLVVYTLFEFIEGGFNYSLLHTGHLVFWVYTLIFAALQYASHSAKKQNIRMVVEFIESNINMFAFIFIYFFLDLRLTLQKEQALGKITAAYASDQLLIWHFIEQFARLMKDPAHIYLLLGSVFLSLTIAYSRIRILLLREKINSLLVRYIGEKTRDKLVKRDSEITSIRIETVVLYSDIRNFTSLSEKNDASDVVSMLNFYYDKWHKTIKSLHGTINKFIGDGLLAYFDDKTDLSENVGLAVHTALSMLEQKTRINKELSVKGLPTIEGIGIGIHCGEVILGDIGGERKDYTLIGDTVNTAARLESLCKTYNTPLIVSDACYMLMDETLKKQFSIISSIAIRGKDESVTLYGLNNL